MRAGLMTHRRDRTLVARVEGEGAMYVRVDGGDVGQGTGLTPAVAATIGTLAAAVVQDLDSLRRHPV